MGVDVTVEIDAERLGQAQCLTGDTSSTHVVEQALSEMIRRRSKIAALLELAGTDPFYEGYDYKALRAGGNDQS